MIVPPLRIVALEVTRTCDLACRHCRGDSRREDYPDELAFSEIRDTLHNIAAFARPILIITGGEPLTRPDVYDIAALSASLGFRTALATCGHLLDDDTVPRLKTAGVMRVSVSLDGAEASTHDRFRGTPGAFEAALRGIGALRRHGLEFQVNSTLTRLNIAELPKLHDLALSLGAAGFHPFLLVPMGRGRGLADNALDPEAYEDALIKIALMAERSPLEIKPTCGPLYIRVVARLRAAAYASPSGAKPRAGGREHPPAPLSMTRGCLGGQGFVFISHRGAVQICGFLEIPAGDLRAEKYDLKKIWESSPLFAEIRNVSRYHGKCGRCEYNRVCGGCRARAFAHSGDYLGEEPNCVYQPKNG